MSVTHGQPIEHLASPPSSFGNQPQAQWPAGLSQLEGVCADLLEERKDTAPEVARRPDAIHLYGVDLLSSSDCLAYFGDWGPTHVEWINDSSCNVIFADEFTAKRAIVGRGRPLPPDEFPDCAGAVYTYLHCFNNGDLTSCFENTDAMGEL